jgi:hypothetical protein
MNYRGLLFKILFCYSIVITVYFFKITDNSNLKHEFSISVRDCISNKHSVCFIDKRFCHPGYTGESCNIKLNPANPWYTFNCPNLNKEITYEINTSLSELSNGQGCKYETRSGITGCAHLCININKFYDYIVLIYSY